MGVPDIPLLDLIEKVRSLASWGGTELSSFTSHLNMASQNSCRECEVELSKFCDKYRCHGCTGWLCGPCVRASGSLAIIAASSGCKDVDHIEKVVRSCKFCSKASKRHIEKIYPSESPQGSPEVASPLAGGEMMQIDKNAKKINEVCIPRTIGFQENSLSPPKMKCIAGRRSQSPLVHSPTQSDEEPEESGRHFFSSSSEYYHDCSDIDTSVSFREDCYSFRSECSSPFASPSRKNINTPRAGLAVQKPSGRSPTPQSNSTFGQGVTAVLRRPDRGSGDPGNAVGKSDVTVIDTRDEKVEKVLDFESNVDFWFPPPPEDENDEAESNYFEYDDDDDNDDGVGVSAGVFSSSGSLSSLFAAQGKQNEDQKEPLKPLIHSHFRALVSQLLQGESFKTGKENESHDWLDIVSTLAWQAANFIKPDTSKGGSMDPVDYVKIKCLASGSPSDSTLVKGVVCTKNIKHKRMTSQYKNPRLLLLGGSLEYQRAHNQLASFNTLLDEEMNHLKMIVSKIEAHRTNVVLVEKTVASYAQEYLLAKEISLVLNVKKPLLERIARCTGASITPSVDNIALARLGHCELFRLEKVSEELETTDQFRKRPSRTLMYFDGCPKRLGCTVLLKGLCLEELKKIKRVVQYAVFAAYHLSLETSFLADEGAHLPKMTLKLSDSASDSLNVDNATSTLHASEMVALCQDLKTVVDLPHGVEAKIEDGVWELKSEHLDSDEALHVDGKTDEALSQVCWECDESVCNTGSLLTDNNLLGETNSTSGFINSAQSELIQTVSPQKISNIEKACENEVSNDYFAAAENHQCILVSFSSCCVSKGILCERSRLLRIRFYGSFDKPLGRYLRDDLLDQASVCRICKEAVEAHVQCYTFRQGSLTVNVRKLDTVKLPGERDEKIWMWHRCLRCAQIDGVPPATRRIVMSDAAWGLSFGKFLELSFSNHATANRVASCGHSLQRDCLRFYGFGSMVAFFHYSPIDILTVHLPPSTIDFNYDSKPEWIRREVEELKFKMETLYVEIIDVLLVMEQKCTSLNIGSSDSNDMLGCILELKDLADKEKHDYHGLLQRASEENSQLINRTFDILELNRLRQSLLIGSRAWDRRLYSLNALLNSRNFSFETSEKTGPHAELTEVSYQSTECIKIAVGQAEKTLGHEPCIKEQSHSDCFPLSVEEVHKDGEISVGENSCENVESPASNLSDKIDSAWIGSDVEASQASPVTQTLADNLPRKRLMAPARVYSFDSAMRMQEKIHRSLRPSHLSAARSFHASGDYRSMVRDPTSNVLRTYLQVPPVEGNLTPSFISSVSLVAEGPRMLLPQIDQNDFVIAVYDDEPTSVISYTLSSKDYKDCISSQQDGSCCSKDVIKDNFTSSTLLPWQSFGSLELDYTSYGSSAFEDASSRSNTGTSDPKRSHLQISFDDDSSFSGGKAKFSVTCYYAKQFDMLRKKCCQTEVDFICSLSRCRRWSAQGGKSNVYFAKSMDERFIIKQVTKTELESFLDFAPEYFKYLNHSLDSGSPTCLAKIFGIFQVTIKHLKGGRETKMDLMVMENLFFKRRVSRIYDLKGSRRSRYNPDAKGASQVLLDMNLLETLRTNPIFLGSKAKRKLERAVWNDTSFLAAVDVIDYSLLVGVDDERKELVLGIIDFMRQYTWDKHLETWVKASGILGGLKNASPTIISPKSYKTRFRKAMTTYFLTVPEQWPS